MIYCLLPKLFWLIMGSCHEKRSFWEMLIFKMIRIRCCLVGRVIYLHKHKHSLPSITAHDPIEWTVSSCLSLMPTNKAFGGISAFQQSRLIEQLWWASAELWHKLHWLFQMNNNEVSLSDQISKWVQEDSTPQDPWFLYLGDLSAHRAPLGP